MQNMRTFTKHVQTRLQHTPLDSPWGVRRVVITEDSQDHYIDTDRMFWRTLSFIEGFQSIDAMQDSKEGREVGYALGMFHNLNRDLSPERLADTLAGFH